MDDTGYTGKPGQFFQEKGVAPMDTVMVSIDDRRVSAVLLPGQGRGDRVRLNIHGHVVGIAWERIRDIEKINHTRPATKQATAAVPATTSPATVVLLSTGGTIAGRPDPHTGGLVAGRSAAELYALVPELAGIARVKMVDLFRVLSEDMEPGHWVEIARAVAREIANGARGIVISHGTDTLHYTASAIAFMVQNPGIPIVLVGSQKSIDRPSSDAALNLIHAVQVAAESDIAEVVVTMFGPTSDQYGLIHRATRVRKMHTSARSTFRTIGDLPLGVVDTKGIRMLRQDYARRGNPEKVDLHIGVSPKAGLLYFHPGMDPDIVDFYLEKGYRGLVVAGTGMGHCSNRMIAALKRATDMGTMVFMTAQTLWGAVNPYAYRTGRALLNAGVIPLKNMLPETALVKLYWALSQHTATTDIIDLMTTPVAHEIIEREPPDGYLIYQGGIPEVAEFLKKERL